jgi:hypothetical protein
MKNWYKTSQAAPEAPPAAPPPAPLPPPPMGMPPPPGGGPSSPAEQRVGAVSGPGLHEVNETEEDDMYKIEKMNKAFKNALDSGRDIEDAAAMAIMATGSNVSIHQLDIAEAFDPDFPDQTPPFIRKITGLDIKTAPPSSQGPPPIG